MKKIQLNVLNKVKMPAGLVNQTNKIKQIKVPGGEKIKNGWNKFKNFGAIKFLYSAKFIRVLIFLFFAIAIIEIGFGVMVYKFKSEDRATRIATKIIPYPIAIVNQDTITYGKYLQEKDYIHHFYQSTSQEQVDYDAIDKEISNQLIENRILAFQAVINKTTVNKGDVDTAINQIIEQNGGQEKVEKVLNDLYGLNLDQFRDLVKEQLTRDKLNDKLIMRVKVSHILVRVDSGATQEQVDAAKAKIDGYLNEIKGGLDFSEAAKKYSEDTGSAESSGSLDPFANGEMVPEFSKASFEGKVGEIVGPIRTDFGWHIIKIEDKTGKIDKPFSDWLTEIKNKSLILKFIK